MAYGVTSHTESCDALHRATVISLHREHALHRERLPPEKVASSHDLTSAPPRHSIPRGHGTHPSKEADSLAGPSDASSRLRCRNSGFMVAAGQRLHSPPWSTNPSSHEQLAWWVHGRAHPEFILHALHMAEPVEENISSGHGSWCSRPRQYWPAGQGSHWREAGR
jgi:hypothetical protein